MHMMSHKSQDYKISAMTHPLTRVASHRAQTHRITRQRFQLPIHSIVCVSCFSCVVCVACMLESKTKVQSRKSTCVMEHF